uniref:Cysteine proteinase inhibitor n=1 Tax=Vitis vinifera TaxID=29760 RepID=F6HRL2_VITVI
MAQVQPYRNMAPLKLDGANTQIDLGGKITTLESKLWTPNHDEDLLQLLGMFSVMEHNREKGCSLKFVNTYEGWYQTLPQNRGTLHKIHLVATDKGVPGNYEACVWEKNCTQDWKKMNLPLDAHLMKIHLELVYFIRLCPEIEPRA